MVNLNGLEFVDTVDTNLLEGVVDLADFEVDIVVDSTLEVVQTVVNK